MRATLPAMEGVDVEDKGGAAFAVHYRRAPNPLRARQALGRWAAGAPGQLEAVWGKMVVELRARGVSKGAAVGQIAAAHPDRVPVYLGDDVTDEEAFEALNALDPRAVTVKVGDGSSSARFRVRGVDEAVSYLGLFDR
jgi:trehalose 6-phosphate phosphatase